jgi:osmotically-inducible protein OsmY
MLRISTDESTTSCASAESSETDPGSLVAARLRRSGYPFLWGVSCEFRDGILTLSGTVPTFHLKQVAQELAAHTLGIRQVENVLRVETSAHRAQAQPR